MVNSHPEYAPVAISVQGGLGGGGTGGSVTEPYNSGYQAGGAGTDALGGGGGSLRADGGDGVVIVRYPNTHAATQLTGFTFANLTEVGGFKIIKITAGSGNIRFTKL